MQQIPQTTDFDLIVIGGGPAGMMAAITAARRGNKVLLLEKLSAPGAKLRATGGGRCNLANTLSKADFINRFGREGRFMTPALQALDHEGLIGFFAGIGVNCHAPDGYRVFPLSHNSHTVVAALENELKALGVTILCAQRAVKIEHEGGAVTGISTQEQTWSCRNLVVSTGGAGYPALGAEGDGYRMAAALGHKVTELFPAMLPLRTRETWVKNCRSDTIGKAEVRINLPEGKKLRATGDLIFTTDGIRGPVVLDFAREITPLLARHGEVPLLINLTQGKNEEIIREHLKKKMAENPRGSFAELLTGLVPRPLAIELCRLAGLDPELAPGSQPAKQRDELIKLLVWTPLTVVGHDGFSMAMITRGGIDLKEISPETLESKLVKGLYFCGEIVNLDGPCGGFNLQWSFSSGFLAGHLGCRP